jgi:ABC-2 type transport system ATP-binding protein
MQHGEVTAPALRLNGLTKRYGSKMAVDDLTLEVQQGQLYALLGPNGAGKTTTLRMVAGLLTPDAGDTFVLGHSVRNAPQAAKQRLAFLPDEPLLYGKLNPLEYLEFVAGLWNVDAERAARRAEELLKWLDLWSERANLTETFSRGMKQKLGLAGGLIHDPEVMILDEPLTGLDAAAARDVKHLLEEFAAAGKTVVFTTHIMEIAERMAKRIGIINHGQLIAEGSLEELRAASGREGGTLESVFLQLVERQ